MTHVLYLHGFASSTGSSKAAYFSARFAEHGIALGCPDFNQPDFSTLTTSRMVAQVGAEIDARPGGEIVLIGSSLGGFVAVLAALARPGRVSRLVLLAPALDFGGNRMRELGDRGIKEWRRTDRLEVFHYGYGRVLPVGFALYEDAQQYDALNAVLPVPVQVFQGRRDASVDPAMVERWASARPGVEVHLLDDDHQLQGSLDYIWREASRFLGLDGSR